jgi:hypothetical protein
MEPIRQVWGDNRREAVVAQHLTHLAPWKLIPTPKFYFTDFHIQRVYDNGRENYIGDLEIKWLNSSSQYPAIFPFNKLQQMMIAPPYTDNAESFHRICFRFSDGLMIIPAKKLAHLQPALHTRKDTDETDLVVWVNVEEFFNYFRPIVINEGSQ